MRRWVGGLLGCWIIGGWGVCCVAQAQTTQNTSSPTFADIAPLLTKHCASCHTARAEGRAAPFALVTYADAARRASQLVQVTQSGYMPPWKTTTSGFHGQRGLSPEEKATLKAWADAGTPEGSGAQQDSQRPTPNAQHPLWPFGKPDLILTMPKAYPLAATTTEISRCFVIPTGLAEEKWIRAVAFRPSNPRIVRYSSLYLDPTRQGRQHEATSGAVGFYGFASGLRPTPNGSLIDWSIGGATLPFPPGVAAKLPKGSDLILQLRFHPTGKPETERMQVGLYFAESRQESEARSRKEDRNLKTASSPTPALESVTLRLGVAELYLPWKSMATETDSFVLPVDVTLWEITPNVHSVGQKISVSAQTPEGKVSEILEIPDWDAAWKQAYRPETPPRLPKGTRLTLKIVYDNTETNPRNPWKPSHRVVPSLEFMEEMGGVWLRLLPTNAADAATLRAALPPKPSAAFDIDELEPEGKQRPRPQPGPPVKRP